MVRILYSSNNTINLFLFFHLHRKIRTSEPYNAWNNHTSNSICSHHTVDLMYLYIRKMPAQNTRPTRKL